MYPDLASMLSMLHGQMGGVYFHQDDNEKAYNQLNQAINYDENNIINWMNMALLELKVGRTDSCMQICEKILMYDPTNEKIYEMKGDLHHRNGQIELAFMYYQKAIDFNPELHSANSSIGDILKKTGKLKEAIDHYKKALSVRIDLADTFSSLCYAKLQCCDWDQ